MKIWHFNPENDLCLGNGDANFVAPLSARKLAADLATLPKWWSTEGDIVLTKDVDSLNILPGDKMMPWGWSISEVIKLRKMGVPTSILPDDEALRENRDLSHRRTSIKILKLLGEASGYHFPLPVLPKELYSKEEVFAWLSESRSRILKTPWSSSGKGLCWCEHASDVEIEHWLKAPLRKMGSVVGEERYRKVVDFAMVFEVDKEKNLRFSGYSLFDTDEKGVYQGNLLWSNEAIVSYLSRFVPESQLLQLEQALISVLESLLPPHYFGYLGVDMMIYEKEEGYALHPCVEMNLRMTMGLVARFVYDKWVASPAQGVFRIARDQKEGELRKLHLGLAEKYPLVKEGIRVKSGYFPLTPVEEDSHYSAYVIIKDENVESDTYVDV